MVQKVIDVDKLRKFKLLIATPMYGGQCCGEFTRSLIDLHIICTKNGLTVKFFYIKNESLISRARNYCADTFVRDTEQTHLMFIDADIEFDPMDVLYMWSQAVDDKDIIAGLYPKKNISWEKIKTAVDKGIPPGELEKYVGDFVLNMKPNEDGSLTHYNVRLDEPLEVADVGTGFVIIQRRVFDRIQKKYPERMYTPDHMRSKDFDGSRDIMDFFPVGIDQETKRYLSEDYYFCLLARKSGSKVWACPWMRINHIGSHKFVGDFASVVSIGESANADSSKLDGLKT